MELNLLPTSATGRDTTEPTVVMVLEQHLGHETFAINLLDEAARYDGVRVRSVPIRYDAAGSRLPAWPRLAGVRGSLAGRREVREGLRRHPGDAWVYNTQVPVALAGRQRRQPYIVITDVTPAQYDRLAGGYGHRADRRGPWKAWKDRVNRRVFRDAAWCVPWSTWAGESIRTEYGVAADRIVVIPPGVDLEAWHMPRAADARDGDRPLRVLFVGGEFGRKGGDVLLGAFNALGKRVELDIVTRSDVGSADGIRVFRDLTPNHPRLLDLYRSADVFVLPTRAETFGIAAVEASAAGLPVVASAVGGLSDIVHDGVTGLLIRPDHPDELAAALDRLHRNRDLRVDMGRRAREHAARNFDAAVNARRLLDLALDCARGRVEH